MMFTRRTLLASVASTLAFLKTWRVARAQTIASTRVTFVLFNDFYQLGEQRLADGKERGGFARLAAVIAAERAKGGHVVVAHGGDTLSPSLMSGFDQGAHIIALMNRLGVDIFAPGNHEFDFGRVVFLKRMQEANFPVYAANLLGGDGAPLPGFKDRSVLTFDGVRVGLTGMAYQNSPKTSATETLRFSPTIATTKSTAAALRADGADFVVAVMHADRGDTLSLQASRAADLLLTGHTHDLFVNFDGENAIVESGFDAHYVTAIDVDIRVSDEGGARKTTWWPQFRVIDTATVTPDAAMAVAVAQVEAQFSREMGVAVARTAVELDSRNATVRTREAAIGNLITDAMRLTTRSDAAILNGGGIRAGRVYPPGSTLARSDVISELPFGNRVVVLEVSGRDLLGALEHGLARLPLASGRFPQVSGIRLRYILARAPGERVISVEVGGKPLDPVRSYRVAVLDFLARGGDDYGMFQTASRITPDNDAPLLASEVMTYLTGLGTVRNGVEGRIVAE